MQISQSSPYTSYNAYTLIGSVTSAGSDTDASKADIEAGPASVVDIQNGQQQDQSTTNSTEVEKKADGTPLSDKEQQELDALKDRDREVRTHEQAHLSAAGQYATSGATYTYTQGPDGQKYATGGEVHIDTAEVSGDTEATISKMQQVYRSALAPQEPSSQDRRVAAKAAATLAKARMDAASGEDEKEGTENTATSTVDSAQRLAADAYAGMQKSDPPASTGLQLAV